MSMRDVQRGVEDFFAQNVTAGLILPNGWFGRPYDNMLDLEKVEVLGEALLVELAGGDRRLAFRGGVLEVGESELGLALRGYSVLTFDWLWYGSDEVKRWVFTGGEVVLAFPDGWLA